MLLEIIAWILIVCMSAFILVWAFAMGRLVLSQRQLPHVRDALGDPPPNPHWPRVSAIVPAHNEEALLDACVASIRNQDYPDLQVIVALDRCDDASPAIAKRHADADARVSVTPNDSHRPGWRGKCLPMQVGSEHADGQWLLFLDADTEIEPEMVRAAVATAHAHGFEMLSVFPDLRCRKRFEHVVQPIASLHLLYMFPPDKVNRANGNSRPFSLGAFTLLRRDRFDAIGGMAAVKDQFMEDINLARAVSKSGGRVGIAQGTGMFRCVMYETYEEFKNGWKRIFIGAANLQVRKLRSHGRRLLALGIAPPLIQLGSAVFATAVTLRGSYLLGGVLGGLVALAVTMQYLALARFYRAAGASPLAPLLFPVGSAGVGLILLRAAGDLRHGRHFTWGGHDYTPEAR